MKKLIGFLFLISLTCLSAQSLYNKPESIVYYSTADCYFVSNEGSGQILKVDRLGNQTVWNSEETISRGITIYGNNLFAACGKNLSVFDLTTAKRIKSIPVSASNDVNDVACDSTGIVYVTVPNEKRVYKVIPSASKCYLFSSSATTHNPNGIMYQHEYKRLLVCHWGTNVPIKTIDINDSSKYQLIPTTLGNLDGIGEDNNGRLYFSSWATDKIYRFDKNLSNTPEVVVEQLNGPADISFNKFRNEICITNWKGNNIKIVPVIPSSVFDAKEKIPSEFTLFQNYPNPFNPETTITFELNEPNYVSLNVYDAAGRFVTTLFSERKNSGTHILKFDSRKFMLSSGVYFIELKTGSVIQSKKMLLLK